MATKTKTRTRKEQPAPEPEPAPAKRSSDPTVSRVSLIGRLVADPVMRYTPSGHAVTNFRLAVNGVNGGQASFHDAVAWRRLGEVAAQYLTKGRLVYLGGRLQSRSWTGRDGVQRQSQEIVASELRFLGPRPVAAEAQSAEKAVAV